MTDQTKQYLIDRFEKNVYMLPHHLRDGLRRYVVDRIEPGSFLMSVLTNDLRATVVRADAASKAALFLIVEFCLYSLPYGCWGSEENVRAWLKGETRMEDYL